MTKYGIIIYTEVVLIVKLITRKASSEARQRADRIIHDVHKQLGKEYRFFAGLLDHKLADVLFRIKTENMIWIIK